MKLEDLGQTKFKDGSLLHEAEVHKIEEPKDILAAVNDVIDKKSMRTLKLRDGKITLDLFTAQALKKIFDHLSLTTRDKVLDFIIDNGKRGFVKVVDKAFGSLN